MQTPEKPRVVGYRDTARYKSQTHTRVIENSGGDTRVGFTCVPAARTAIET